MDIKRDVYLNRLVDSMDNHLIKIITGVRRCGKSYLLNTLFYDYLVEHKVPLDHIISISFEDRTNLSLRNPDNLLLKIKESIKDSEKYYILLDEIQMVDEFYDVLNSLLHIRNADVYVTGSNSKFLSKDIATEFRGRSDEIHILPLSFSEFLQAYSGTKEEALNEYMLHGGMPLILSYKTDDRKEEYLKNLFKATYLKDIVERNHLKYTNKIDELTSVIASSVGSLINTNKITNTFKNMEDRTISKETVDNYLDYLEDSFIIRHAPRYDIKGRKYIGSTKKYYFVDPGLRNAKLDFIHNDYGAIMENIIYNELIYRGYNVSVGLVTLNLKNENNTSYRQQLEVDFVAIKGSKKYYIQSSLEMLSEAKIKQEERSLINIDDSFRKIIIVKDNIKVRHNVNGISVIGIIEFLTNLDSLDL